ncbi:MAG: ribosome small subunit-dependent GTPase A [Bacteroidales bacterium]|nr:ribosome small subunit-dependent GTPase A [Bacteroidales bacterium]
MTLEDLGFNVTLEQIRIELKLDCYDIGRVAAVHKERCIVRSARRVYDSELLGNLRHTAEDRSDFPVVGDWVAISSYDDDHAIIHRVFPRTTVLERQAVGMFGEKQIIASNIDYSLIVQAVDRDFNINRLERYLTISSAGRVIPIIILSKIDLINEIQLSETIKRIKTRIDDIAIIPISNETTTGYEQLVSIFNKGKTYCLLGSSGAGKSTLINNLSGQELMKTGSISLSTKKGRHITSHREMIVLEQGGIIIDNPGMREIGIADTTDGLESTFDDIIKYAANCRFSDCSHLREKGCAVLEAVEKGEIDRSSYENYMKMSREKIRFQSSVAEKRKKDKEFGKMVKEIKRLKKGGDDIGL